ncbi:putative regulatory protein, FmdB family [Kytococcus aerolatus]|uniref:Putative regulatory protein, FmdB family n=1 Tax=Kytococcus aerolatus TaxID=592308 RepID=A0A212TBJ4_9MICO|nr:zinc ribbon domain-containing protein [Kytococcus aerolatus]SNC63418.1 putative regulatory protein, FmdB family [Kytococcus aerolatus]
MPLYEIRCEAQHDTEVNIPLAQADDPVACPECGTAARRRISSPRIGRGNDPRARLIESTQATAHQPGVVDAIPASGNRRPTPVSRDPRHAKLPRP